MNEINRRGPSVGTGRLFTMLLPSLFGSSSETDPKSLIAGLYHIPVTLGAPSGHLEHQLTNSITSFLFPQTTVS